MANSPKASRSSSIQLQQQDGLGYLMIDPSKIPSSLGEHIRIFNLHEGAQQIVGYCIPLKQCSGIIKMISLARIIKTVESPFINEAFMAKYKFNFLPQLINTVPMNEKEFREMLRTPPMPLRGQQNAHRNRFFVRAQPTQQQLKRPQPDDTAMSFAHEKFKLYQNPHLIPYRFPDGLDCFLRLDLATHCQHDIPANEPRSMAPRRQHQHNPHYHSVRGHYHVEEDSNARKISGNNNLGGGRQKITSNSSSK